MEDKKLSDEEERERILEIIEKEFDLELLLKYRELRILEHEIERGRELRGILEKLILNEYIYGDRNGPTRYKSTGPQFQAPLEQQQELAMLALGTRSRGGLGPSGDSLGSMGTTNLTTTPMSNYSNFAATNAAAQSSQQHQYDIRADGTVVRMRCPGCGAEKFRSMLGFVNHCRIHCKITFGSQEERLQKCGVVVEDHEVPKQFRSFSQASGSLIQQSMTLNQICADMMPVKVVEDSKPFIEEVPCDPDGITHTTSIAADFFPEYTTSDLEQVSLKPVVEDLKPEIESSELPQRPPSLSPSNESRYYWKHQVIIGNVAKCLLNSGGLETVNMVGGRPASHYFKIYIREANFRDPNTIRNRILQHVKFVRFYLHSAYKPEDVIDVYERPFELERPAWGEFPLRIQLHFFDDRANKPIDLIHSLSLFSATTARYEEAIERLHDIDLDKRTDFNASNEGGKDSRDGAEGKDTSNKLLEALEPLDEDSGSDSGNEDYNQSSLGANMADKQRIADPFSLKYCRYCGVPHHPQQNFEIVQKNCVSKPRRIRFNSRTSALDAFALVTLQSKEIEYYAQESRLEEQVDSDDPWNKELMAADDSNETKLVASLIHQLRLANFVPTKDICVVLRGALRAFLKHLIKDSCDQIPSDKTKAALDEGFPTAISPLNLYQAIIAGIGDPITSDVMDHPPPFDFLSNAYLSGSNFYTNSGSAAGSSAKKS